MAKIIMGAPRKPVKSQRLKGATLLFTKKEFRGLEERFAKLDDDDKIFNGGGKPARIGAFLRDLLLSTLEVERETILKEKPEAGPIGRPRKEKRGRQ